MRGEVDSGRGRKEKPGQRCECVGTGYEMKEELDNDHLLSITELRRDMRNFF